MHNTTHSLTTPPKRLHGTDKGLIRPSQGTIVTTNPIPEMHGVGSDCKLGRPSLMSRNQ